MDTPPPTPPITPPALWNPNAAACWSLLFSPAFGAYLHARNADALGRTEEAKTNRVWFYVSLGFLGCFLISVFIPSITDSIIQGASIGLLFGWYFSLGKKQIQFVKGNLQVGYPRKSWMTPLLIGFGCLVAYVVAGFILTFVSEVVSGFSFTHQQRLDGATKKLDQTATETERFYALNDAAKESFVAGKTEDARKYANELLSLIPKFKGDWNYGNAVQDANLVLSRIAVQEGHVPEAKQFLLEAGKSPGSPQMNSFGPNMSLANDLLGKGEKDVVVEYFELCRKFWRMDNGQLNQWHQEVKSGKIPDFGANLVY